MGISPQIVLHLVRRTRYARCGAVVDVALRRREASLALGAAPTRSFSTQFIGRGTSTTIKKGVKKPAVSSVKRMQPLQELPPSLQGQSLLSSTSSPSSSSSSSSSSFPSVSRTSATHPLLDAEEIITVLTDVFLSYREHIRKKNTTDKAGESCVDGGGGSSNAIVPFYPPVPLCHLEQCFQSVLQRLLPAGSTMLEVRVTGDDEVSKKNRQHLANRIQSSGVFTLAPTTRGSLHRIESTSAACSAGANMFVLRVKPGVRELAADIAAFLFSLGPAPAALRRAVPLAVIWRMSLSPAAAAFIRNELANDVKRLILVYQPDVFTLTKNGAMVQVRGAPVDKGGQQTMTPSSSSSSSSSSLEVSVPLSVEPSLTALQSKCSASPNVETVNAPALPDALVSSPSPNHSIFHFAAGEADTFVHMGKRFIAPAAMERYRLSQRLVPFLEFIPLAASTSAGGVFGSCRRCKLGGSGSGNGKRNNNYDDDDDDDCDGFVDFVVVRERAVEKYPHLSPHLELNHNDILQRHEGHLLSALVALGVEWRWGRSPPSPPPPPEASSSFIKDHHQKQRRRQQQQQQQHTSDKGGRLSSTGPLFLRRRCCSAPKAAATAEEATPGSSTAENKRLQLLLIDLQVEQDEIIVQPRILEWWKCVHHSDMVDDSNENKVTGRAMDTNDRVLFALHASVYEELVGPAAVMAAAAAAAATETMAVISPLPSVGPIPSRSAMYPAGACADGAFVQHILRYFTTRQHEDLQSTLLEEVQGGVAPLFQYEVMESIACLFFPYGRGSAGADRAPTEKLDGRNRESRGTDVHPLVFNRYVDGFYAQHGTSRFPFIRPRLMPGVPSLACRRLLPARLVLEILRCLYRQQLRYAEEIGLPVDDDDIDGEGGCCLSFKAFCHLLHPASRAYIRDHIGDHTLISLLVSHLPRHFCVPMLETVPSWSAVGLTREGRRLAQSLEEETKAGAKTTAASLSKHADGEHPTGYRSRSTGCIFTNDTRQQLDAFILCR